MTRTGVAAYRYSRYNQLAIYMIETNLKKNESQNSLGWSHCPKGLFCGIYLQPQDFDLDAVSQFNEGITFSNNIRTIKKFIEYTKSAK